MHGAGRVKEGQTTSCFILKNIVLLVWKVFPFSNPAIQYHPIDLIIYHPTSPRGFMIFPVGIERNQRYEAGYTRYYSNTHLV